MGKILTKSMAKSQPFHINIAVRIWDEQTVFDRQHLFFVCLFVFVFVFVFVFLIQMECQYTHK